MTRTFQRTIACLFLAATLTGCTSMKPLEWNEPTRYRGFTNCFEGDEEKTLQDLRDMKRDWNANMVRLMMRPCFLSKIRKLPTYQAGWERYMSFLPTYLDLAGKLDVAVVLDLHGVPNENKKALAEKHADNNKDRLAAYWADPNHAKTVIACWKEVAELCRDRKQVIWFDILNEPLDWYDMPLYPKGWPKLAQDCVDAIREIDTIHPIVIEPGPGGLCGGFRTFPLLKGTDIIYSVHQYNPHQYTHQGIGDLRNTDLAKAYLERQQPWPGKYSGVTWDKARIEKSLAAPIEFQKKHNVRIYVGEWSAARWAPNADQYLQDCVDVFEKLNWDWTVHAFRESRIWSFEHDDNYGDAVESTTPTKRAQVIKKAMAKNR